ncbi:hypothetical protein [Azospirillum sp. SYSU D00513]|uniref:hypothetical protein n=1 Tax=Azospirillum sp. SYSU D00513 TaxID=2812561 RepID=UPI001A9772DD|nr:hypothetical protein [Azospirillum sp. SYSU D00513]
MATRSFPTTFAAMLSPFIIWAAQFMAVYGINGLACARGLSDRTLLGLPLVPVLVTAVTLLALLLTLAVLVKALVGGGPAAHVQSGAPRSFARWMTAAGAVSCLLAILWVGLPALMVPACG